MERDRHLEKYLVPLASLGLLVVAAFSAFSRETREKIWERDKGRSAESGMAGDLECAHYDHSRGSHYDDPENGRLLTTREHYLDHYYRHGHNGLTKSQNRWSLDKIWERLSDSEREGLPTPDSV